MRFTQDHEFIEVAGDIATVGISAHAQQQLGDIVFVEVPHVGAKFKKGDAAAVVESVKAASEVYAPVSGAIVAANDKLAAEPATVNAEPMAGGWFVKIKLSKPAELDGLMDEAAYNKYLKGLH